MTAFYLSGVEGGPTGTRGRTCRQSAGRETGSSTSTLSPSKNLFKSHVLHLEDPRNYRLTGTGSPDTKAQLSHQSEVFSSIRCYRSWRSPKYLSSFPRAQMTRDKCVKCNKRVWRKSHEEGLFYRL